MNTLTPTGTAATSPAAVPACSLLDHPPRPRPRRRRVWLLAADELGPDEYAPPPDWIHELREDF